MASNTKEIIVSTFLDLIKNEDFDKITVTDLVEKCDISRQTFYYHFDDISKMLEWAFAKETQLICESAKPYSSWVDAICEYKGFVEKYELLIKKAINSSQCMDIYNLLFNSFTKFLTTGACRKRTFNNPNYEFLIECSANAFAGTLVQGIQRGNFDFDDITHKVHLCFSK